MSGSAGYDIRGVYSEWKESWGQAEKAVHMSLSDDMISFDLYAGPVDGYAYCPGGVWDVDYGLTASLVVGIGGSASDVSFTCLSNGRVLKGKLYCGVISAPILVDVGVGWVVDMESVGPGRKISGKYQRYDIENYITKGWVLASPMGTATSGSSVAVTRGASFGIGYAWCNAEYIKTGN